MSKAGYSIRTKLIAIFVLIKVLPLIALAWFFWLGISHLADSLNTQTAKMAEDSGRLVGGIADMATGNSIEALDNHSREAIERLTTDTARRVAAFLYDRDVDIRQAAQLDPTPENFTDFLSKRTRPVMLDNGSWQMDEAGEKWIQTAPEPQNTKDVTARNKDNETQFHYRPPEPEARIEQRPLFLEMTYVDLSGKEKVKVITSHLLPDTLLDISKKENTFCRAETYFESLKTITPEDIYVSEVIGPYVKGFLPGGPYSKVRAKQRNMAFEPETSGYAGKENPLGIRFQGLIRWAAPVVSQGEVKGYVTLALDHTHIMEFTDHLVPTPERYCITSDAGSGNYAFMWDYKGRNISHPRDYFIYGYDPETGEQAVPWLEASLYPQWLECRGSMTEFEKKVPWFDAQSLKKKPSAELTGQGFVGLDGRFLNFAPQCTGWHTLTQHGGSGSFLIFWSKLWKLTTAAAIPYHTGIYKAHPRGFGYVTIGANVDQFHKPAVDTAAKIDAVKKAFENNLKQQKEDNQAYIRSILHNTSIRMAVYTLLMVALVIFIALWMAAALTGKITHMIHGIRTFREGDRTFRLTQTSTDEMGQLVFSFNQMADKIQQSLEETESARETAEQANIRLKTEVADRKAAQEELSRHKEHLEDMVKERTAELEKQILERKRAEEELVQSEKMAALGQLIAGIAHEINTPMGAIKSSGSNISDSISHLNEDLPAVAASLEPDQFRLFQDLLKKPEQRATLLTSREERKLIRKVSETLANEGIDNSRQMAFLLVQLNAHENVDDFFPLLKHKNSEFIFETAYGLYSVTSNTANINQAVDRISKIIYALKSYVRQGDSNEKTPTDIVEGIETVLTIYHSQIKQDIELIKDVNPVSPIMGYPDELNQVWTNLIHNALQAMDYKGVLKITVTDQGREVAVSISDTGCGIPEENMDKIFNPFFTTKPRGEGSGLGLDIIKKIIERHDGRIGLDSIVGKGTTFTVFLPKQGDA